MGLFTAALAIGSLVLGSKSAKKAAKKAKKAQSQAERDAMLDSYERGMTAYLDDLRSINPVYASERKGDIRASYGADLARRLGMEPPPEAK